MLFRKNSYENILSNQCETGNSHCYDGHKGVVEYEENLRLGADPSTVLTDPEKENIKHNVVKLYFK